MTLFSVGNNLIVHEDKPFSFPDPVTLIYNNNYTYHFEVDHVLYMTLSDGEVDAVTFSTGTGGTLAGVSMFLKSKNPKIKAVLADPEVRKFMCVY